MWFLNLFGICCWQSFFLCLAGMLCAVATAPVVILTGVGVLGVLTWIAGAILMCASVHINCRRMEIVDIREEE